MYQDSQTAEKEKNVTLDAILMQNRLWRPSVKNKDFFSSYMRWRKNNDQFYKKKLVTNPTAKSIQAF